MSNWARLGQRFPTKSHFEGARRGGKISEGEREGNLKVDLKLPKPAGGVGWTGGGRSQQERGFGRGKLKKKKPGERREKGISTRGRLGLSKNHQIEIPIPRGEGGGDVKQEGKGLLHSNGALGGCLRVVLYRGRSIAHYVGGRVLPT